MHSFFRLTIILSICLSTGSSRCAASDYPFDVRVTGKGTGAILFIPGFACSGAVWDQVTPLFADRFTCYTLTMAGFAGYPPQPAASFEYWKQQIAAFIRDQKLQPVTLVGHSLGGCLAMAIAASYPDLIKQVVIVDALPCLPAFYNPGFTVKTDNDCQPAISRLTAMTSENFEKMQQMSAPQLATDTAARNLIVKWSVLSDRETFARIYCDFSNLDLRPSLGAIKCPTLILLQPFFATAQETVTAQYKDLQTATLRFASKGLHFIMYDNPAWLRQQLLEFIGP